MNIIIRDAGQPDAETIARIYNQGIDERGATFETEPRTADDIASSWRIPSATLSWWPRRATR
jgi:phosphinothricin acetyltransferase